MNICPLKWYHHIPWNLPSCPCVRNYVVRIYCLTLMIFHHCDWTYHDLWKHLMTVTKFAISHCWWTVRIGLIGRILNWEEWQVVRASWTCKHYAWLCVSIQDLVWLPKRLIRTNLIHQTIYYWIVTFKIQNLVSFPKTDFKTVVGLVPQDFIKKSHVGLNTIRKPSLNGWPKIRQKVMGVIFKKKNLDYVENVFVVNS